MSQLISPGGEDSATEVLREEQGYTSPTCDKCGAPINAHDALACRKCGWYASINAYVEIDRAWEDDADGLPQAEKKFSVPAWTWTMIACVVAVIVESIAARILTADGSAERTMWSVTQLFVGMSLAGVCHLIAFILLMREVSDFGLLDIILKPIKPWIMRVHELPRYQWLCHLGASSVVAVLMSVLVIGGIPYERLLDWGTKKPVKQNLMGAVMDQAKKIEGEEKSLEEAVQDFAGKQDVTDEGKPKAKKTEPKERQQDDCVIIGYRPTSEGIVYQLLLAGENYGKLQYVGSVTPQLSVKELRELTSQLAVHKAHEPFVKMALDPGIVWVKPRVACRVSYAYKGKKGGLFEIKLESMLGEIAAAEPVEEAKKE
jgi:ribosomal protein L40E